MRRRALAIILAHVVLVAGAVYLIVNHLPLRADFSYLLPQDTQSVKDLRRLEARVRAGDSALVVVEARTPEDRAGIVDALVDGIRKIRPELVESVEADDSELRTFLRERRHLLVPLAELEKARDALAGYLRDAKLKANPLYIDLDEPDPQAADKQKQQLEELRTKRREAEAGLDRAGNVSADGLVAVVQIRTPFRSTDAGKGATLLAELDTVRERVMRTYPSAKIGFTGGVVTSVAEHDAISEGMLVSSVVTGLLVALVLALYFRSATLLGLLLSTLAVATALAFGIAAITVGHLNAATAFLGAIIAGNGVNYGIFLIARYLEERRRHDVDVALSHAIVGTLRPTAIASLGASIAYGSLAVTSFRGFADFAVIGAVGMMVCWMASYILLPALLLRCGRDTRIFHGDPIVGGTLVRILGFRRSNLVCAVALAVCLVSVVIVVRYIKADPFEYDITQLRSQGGEAVTARRWMSLSDKHFGRGITARTYIAADRLDQVPMIIGALRGRDAIGTVNSILDVVPLDQAKKIAVLAEIREILDGALDALDDKERTELAEMRPPDNLAAFTAESLPASLKQRLTERDGRIGYLIQIRPANELDEWNGRDLVRFANAVRSMTLEDGETVTTSGASVIFADILEAIERDGLRVTTVAAGGLVIMVLLLVGFNRRAAAVLIGTGSGTLLMVALCAVLGIKVNFLDFIALPITLGLGIDYAINVAHRHDAEELPDPIETLRTSGSAVFVCSLTTMIGYGSLIFSQNLAIRGFGTASLIGEVTCVLTALVLVPAFLAFRPR
ncbi:MAG: MMPL family transporter [Myxococcota bacterium]|nr:MMPL family transporter [Myxococcota bacterium]